MPHNLSVDRRLIINRDGTTGFRMRNSSGGTINAGEVVVLDTAQQTGDAVTTTTTQDDPNIFGVMMETVLNGASGFVARSGHIDNLKVNGTTDIAVGDKLTTFTTAGIAAKQSAATKPGVFAIALEAYSTNDSLGVIDAFLFEAGRTDASGNTLTYGTAGQMASDGLASANAAGSTNAVARIDHQHTHTADTPALVFGTTNTAGTAGLMLASDATIAIFDATVPTTIQPDAAAATGSAAFAARRDHTHAIDAAAPADGSLAASNAEGTGNSFSRSTHNHKAIVLDDVPWIVGTDADVEFDWATGDADNHTLVLGLGNTNRSFHIAELADAGTDWNVAAQSHPTLYLHSATTPATDYISLNHNATTATFTVASGALAFDVNGVITIENNVDGTSNQLVNFKGDNATRANNDQIYASFSLANSAGTSTEYGRITMQAIDVTNTSEDGTMKFAVKSAGTLSGYLEFQNTTGGVKATVFNEDSEDIDLRVESNGIANMLVVDGGNDTLSIGAASNVDRFVLVAPQARTATANTNYFHMSIAAGGAVTVPAGTTAIVASMNISEPNITATGTVTRATTLYIPDAPTEGGTANYAAWLDSGALRVDGDVDLADGAVDILIKSATAAALEVSDGTVKMLAFDSRATTDNVTQVKVTGVAPTIANVAGTTFNVMAIAALTTTLSATTGVTAMNGLTLDLGAPTINQSGGAVTVTTASALMVRAPVAGASVTISNRYIINTDVAGCFLTAAGAWTDASTREVKHDIHPVDFDKVLEDIQRTMAVTYVHNDESDGGVERYGVVAEDVPDFLAAPGRKGVAAIHVAGFALAGVKALLHENEELKQRVSELEARLAV